MNIGDVCLLDVPRPGGGPNGHIKGIIFTN